MSHITLIAAMTADGIIGKNGRLPWRIPEELAHFKQVTMGKPLIMGRKTFDSLGGRTLPDRQMIVVSHSGLSVDEAIKQAANAPEIMVIGGAQIYELFLPIADKIIMSIIHEAYDGDTYFPNIDWSSWKLLSEKVYEKFTVKEYVI